jgi:phage tail tape-measure protein
MLDTLANASEASALRRQRMKTMAEVRDTTVQHGIDNDPNNDTQKGATLGGAGGAVTGAVAGSAMGPVGTVVGAVVGGVVGAAASGAAVNAVDRVDNDNTVTGIGDTPSRTTTDYDTDVRYDQYGNPISNAAADVNHVRRDGVQTGGYDADGTPDTRGISEKAADAVTGDRIDDKTGKPVA